MKKIIFILSITLLVCCTSSNDFDKGKELLEQQGFTDVQRDGYAPFCCGDDYTFKTGWTARDKQGHKSAGCMCSSLLKGMTIKYK